MSFRSILVLLLGAGILASAAQAITIDSFTTNQAAVTDPPGTTPTVVTGGADIIGTRRAINTDLLVLPSGLGVGPALTSVSGGALSFSVTGTTPDSRGQGILTWDGDATASNLNVTGLAGQNLTAGNHNAIRLLVNSASAGSELVVDVHSSATAASRGFLRIPSAIAAPTSLYLTYAYDFIPIAASPADFTSVGAIQLRVRGTEATVNLDLMETVGPALTATKRDLDLANVPIAGPVLEGTTLKYRVTVTNGGGGLVEAADLVDTPDTNAPHNATTVRATPVAIDDSYKTPGNVGFAMGSPGLLANDIDPDTAGALPELVIAAASVGSFPTTLGGSISVSADGSFTYAPPSGVAHSVDTFAYTLQDNDAQTTTGLVKVAIGPRIWFVDDVHPGTNVGTAGNPFVGFTASNLDGAGGAGDQDAPGDIIFMFAGTLGTGGGAGLELEADQQLLGEGEGLTVDGQVIVAPGTDPVLTSAGHGITLSTNNTLRGFTVGNTGGTSFDLVGSAFGTLTASNLVLNGTGGGISFTNGTLAAVLDSVTSTSGTHGFNLDTVAGTLTVAGATTLSDTTFGIRVNNSGTLAVHLNGTTALTTSAGTALFAATGGTLNFSGTANTVVATGGAAIDVTSTSFGAGATFATVSATTAAGKGLNLDNVTGALTGTAGTINVSAGGGTAFDINAGASNVTYGGTVTSTAASRLVEVTGRTGGAVTLSGNLNGSGAGHTGINVASNSSGAPTINFSGASKVVNTGANAAVSLATNTGATINFTGGGLDIDTTSGAGLSVTGGGTITAQGSGNTVSTGTGTGVVITDTKIGAAGVTFASVSSNGATRGIELSHTCGATSAGFCRTEPAGVGVFSVTGNTVTPGVCTDATPTCSGGTIQSTTDDGIDLLDVGKIHLTRVRVTLSAENGIYGQDVHGFVLENSLIDRNGNQNTPDENGADFHNLTGSAAGGSWPTQILSTIFKDNWEFELRVENALGVLTDLQLTDVSVLVSDTTKLEHGDMAAVKGVGTSVITANVTNLTCNGLIQVSPGITTGTCFALDSSGAGATVNVTGGSLSNSNAGVVLSNDALGSLTFDVNGVVSWPMRSQNMRVFVAGNPPFNRPVVGKFRNNTIGDAAQLNSGSQLGSGISVQNEGAVDATISITGNHIHQIQNFQGISMNVGLGGTPPPATGGGTTNLTITNNVITNINNSRAATLQINQDATAPLPSVCVNAASNTTAAIAGQAGDGTILRIREGGGTFNVNNLTPTAAANPSEYDDAFGFNDPTKVAIQGTPQFGTAPACPTPP